MIPRAENPVLLAAAVPLALGIAALIAAALPTLVWVNAPPSTIGAAPPLLSFGARPNYPLTSYAAIANWPLFNDERRSDPPPPPPAAPKPPPLPSAENYRLVGLVLSPDVHIALVVRQKDGVVLRLHPGDMLDGWTVQAVDPSGVQLSGQSATTQLKMARAASSRPAFGSPLTAASGAAPVAPKQSVP